MEGLLQVSAQATVLRVNALDEEEVELTVRGDSNLASAGAHVGLAEGKLVNRPGAAEEGDVLVVALLASL